MYFPGIAAFTRNQKKIWWILIFGGVIYGIYRQVSFSTLFSLSSLLNHDSRFSKAWPDSLKRSDDLWLFSCADDSERCPGTTWWSPCSKECLDGPGLPGTRHRLVYTRHLEPVTRNGCGQLDPGDFTVSCRAVREEEICIGNRYCQPRKWPTFTILFHRSELGSLTDFTTGREMNHFSTHVTLIDWLFFYWTPYKL